MTGDIKRPGDVDSIAGSGQSLRSRAEIIVLEKSARSPENIQAMPPEEAQQLLHELRVHQIELEMQNEELRRTQMELGAEKARYFDLYDLAPVGYVTLSEKGLIIESNLTVASLLGMARGVIVKQPFTSFILQEDQDIYYLHRKQLFETGEQQVCELRMVKKDKATFWGHLSAVAAKDNEGAPVCRVVIVDITGLKQAGDKIKSQLAELHRWQNVMFGREDRVMELKREVNEFCRSTGEPIRYPSQEVEPADSEEPKL